MYIPLAGEAFLLLLVTELTIMSSFDFLFFLELELESDSLVCSASSPAYR
jgi:hypothetical protein